MEVDDTYFGADLDLKDIYQAMDQVMIEIETTEEPVKETCYSCSLCSKSFRSFRGLAIHEGRKHGAVAAAPAIYETSLSTKELQDYWEEASKSASGYTGASLLDTPLTDDLRECVENVFKSTKHIPSFSANFVSVLHQKVLEKSTRAVLIELLPKLVAKKEQIPKTSENATTTFLNDVEKEVCFYIGGRVIRSLYYRTDDPIYLKLRGENPSLTRNCWGINDIAQRIFYRTECSIVSYLASVRDQFEPCLIAEEVMEILKDKIFDWLQEIDAYSPKSLERVTDMIEKYARTRGHAYAKRITQLIQREKQMVNKTSGNGKGQRASFRRNLQSSN